MSEISEKKPIYKKWWFWVIIAIAVSGIIGAVSAPLASSGDNDGGNGNGNGNGNTTTNAYIGDAVTSGKMEFTVVSVENKSLLGTELVGASTENNFIVIQLQIKNIGNSESDLISSYFEVAKGEAKYEIHSGSIYLENGFYILVTIGSGIGKTVYMAFETPTKSTSDSYCLNVKGSSFSAKKSIQLSKKPS